MPSSLRSNGKVWGSSFCSSKRARPASPSQCQATCKCEVYPLGGLPPFVQRLGHRPWRRHTRSPQANRAQTLHPGRSFTPLFPHKNHIYHTLSSPSSSPRVLDESNKGRDVTQHPSLRNRPRPCPCPGSGRPRCSFRSGGHRRRRRERGRIQLGERGGGECEAAGHEVGTRGDAQRLQEGWGGMGWGA